MLDYYLFSSDKVIEENNTETQFNVTIKYILIKTPEKAAKISYLAYSKI